MPLPVNRFTLYSAVGGALAGAKGYSPLTALGVAIALEVWDTYRQRSTGVPPPPDDAERHLVNLGAGMLGWWVARGVARSNPSHGEYLDGGTQAEIDESFRKLPVKVYR